MRTAGVKIKEHPKAGHHKCTAQKPKITTSEKWKKQPGIYNYNWQSTSFPKELYFCKINVVGIIENQKWLKQ